MTMLQVIGGRERDLGGFVVRRVASTPERLDAAEGRWKNRQFAPVPHETEFIPLPS